MAEDQAQDEQHPNRRQRNLQMTHFTVICVYHSHARHHNVSSFQLNFVTNSWKSKHPIWRRGRRARCGVASLTPHAEYPDRRNRRKHWPPIGRMQYRTLQHQRREWETGDRTNPHRRTSCRGFPCGLRSKEWPPPNSSGGDHDEGTSACWTLWHSVYRRHHNRIVPQEGLEEKIAQALTDTVDNLNSEKNDIWPHGVQFKVPVTGLALFLSVRTRQESTLEWTVSTVFHSMLSWHRDRDKYHEWSSLKAATEKSHDASGCP